MKIAHIVHALKPNPGSDLIHAQPMTFESMLNAKQNDTNIELLCTVFPGNDNLIPDGFVKASNITDDLSNYVPNSRKLPFIKEIFDKCYDSGADYIIYTNVDISLTKEFYSKVKDYISLGHDAIIINRTTMPSYNNQSLQWYLDNIEQGSPHPGYDCFVIQRDLYKKMVLDNIVIGVNWIGEVVIQNIFYFAKNPILLQRSNLTFHMGDDRTWHDPKHAEERNWNQSHAKNILNGFRR